MKKLLIGAIVAAGVVAAVMYIKHLHDKNSFIEEDDDCDWDDDFMTDDEDVEEVVEEEIIEEDSVDEISDTADDNPKYDNEISQMVDILDTADKLIKEEIFDIAMFSIRLGMETGVKCIVSHGAGEYSHSGLGNDIKICRKHGLLPDDFIDDLQEARRKCNNTAHSIKENSGYDDALFCYGVLNELIGKVIELA